ncbi:MAG: NAD(+) synthase, partial [Alistipes sp.]|nr:NAD(+) synthase [Alistipes sp.]
SFRVNHAGDENMVIEMEIPEPMQTTGLDRTISPTPFLPQADEDPNTFYHEVLEIQSHGLAKRLQHTHCTRAIIGISGGLDSTLALLAVVRTFDKLGIDRKQIIGVTMPGFGTSDRTYQNAVELMELLGITSREISIRAACEQHFRDIALDPADRSAAYENAQARERTQILMDLANMENAIVIGTGDLSELALGWATYNGDQMSMYGINGSVPKTLVRALVSWSAEQYAAGDRIREILLDVVATPVSPELLPANQQGEIDQKTENLVGPYELHDFFLYHFIHSGYGPRKLLYVAEIAFQGLYDSETIRHWIEVFFRRFFSQQFKRSAMPDGPKVGSVSLSPRGAWRMPSDASARMWFNEIESLYQ